MLDLLWVSRRWSWSICYCGFLVWGLIDSADYCSLVFVVLCCWAWVVLAGYASLVVVRVTCSLVLLLRCY